MIKKRPWLEKNEHDAGHPSWSVQSPVYRGIAGETAPTSIVGETPIGVARSLRSCVKKPCRMTSGKAVGVPLRKDLEQSGRRADHQSLISPDRPRAGRRLLIGLLAVAPPVR